MPSEFSKTRNETEVLRNAKAPAEEDLPVEQKDQEVASVRSLKAEKFVTRL